MPTPTAQEPAASAPSQSEAPPEPVSAPARDLEPGDKVLHRLFGRGLVLKVLAEGGSTTVEVLFETAGRKTLDVAYARLERV